MERETWKGKHTLGLQSVCSSDRWRVYSRMGKFGTDGSKVVSPKPNIGKRIQNKKD